MDFAIGTPPEEDVKPGLSRKVQSELNLTKLARLDTASSATDSSFTSALAAFFVLVFRALGAALGDGAVLGADPFCCAACLRVVGMSYVVVLV